MSLATYESAQGSVNVGIKYLAHVLNSMKFLSGSHAEIASIKVRFVN
jgi:hypothetical protein